MLKARGRDIRSVSIHRFDSQSQAKPPFILVLTNTIMLARSARVPYVCQRCLRTQRRRLYTDSAAPPPPPSSGAAKLTNRRLISLHGQDASKFLQGIVTANIQPETKAGLFTAFLNAQGRVLSDAFIYPTHGSAWHADANRSDELGYVVEVDAEQAGDLMKQLKKHKLRSKFKLRLLEPGELDVWSVWREDDRWTAHTKAANESGILELTDCRAPGMGQRLLLPEGKRDGMEEMEDTTLSAYDIRRYMRGVAEGQREIPTEDSLPMNHNIDLMGGIDFKKGCYIGQELTIRTHHTGVVRRRMLPVILYDHAQEPPQGLQYNAIDHQVAAETDIKRDDKRRRATGKYVTGVGNVGLAMCRLEQMTDLKVSGEGSSFSPEDRFLVQDIDGKELGVKAFVPDWIRGRVREPKVQKRVG